MPARRTSFVLEVFLVAFAALLLEISYTRVFSFKVSSYYTYLIIGFALLGLGAGGVFVAVSERLRSLGPERGLPWICGLGGVTVGLGYAVVAALELSTYEAPTSAGPLLALTTAATVLFASFASVGLVLALVFGREPERIARLYGADLAGAGFGCAAAVPLLLLLTPPGCVLAAGAALCAAGLRPALRRGPRATAALALPTVALALVAAFADRLPDPVVDAAKTMGRENIERWGFEPVFQRWHPVFRVDVLESPLLEGRKALVHDGDWGSVLLPWDRAPESLAGEYAGSNRALPFAVTNPAPRVLVIGSAGGNEIRASIRFGAESITGVELNPVTVSLLTDHFADFTGHLPELPQVSLHNDEGRSFLRRDGSRYDLIWFVAPDSYATMNAAQASGFVLVESYLYTVEMILETLDHLAPGGVLAMQNGEVDYARKPNRTARYLATVREALARRGVRDFERHVLLATNVDYPLQLSTLLFSETAFSEAQIGAFVRATAKVETGTPRHTPGAEASGGLPSAVIRADDAELPAVLDAWAYDVSAVTDDAPFFWHFARFGDLVTGGNPLLRHPIGPEDGRGERVLLVMLAVSSVFAAGFLLLPFALVRDRWRELPHKSATLAYFACLGLGFMAFEIVLIQKLTLFLGYPTYTLTVTLFSLLVFSGLGSAAAGSYLERRDRVLPLLVATLAVLTLFLQFGIDPVVGALIGLPLPARIVIAAIPLAALGLALGAFMPLGLTTVSRLTPHRAEVVAWSWAVNGVFSVIGSLAATMLSMSYGFRVVLLLAWLLYVAAGLALRALPLRTAP